MNKIAKAFENSKALGGFVTAGDPNLKSSEQIIISMAQAGCDFIEIGIPFSDPIAEDKDIQAADMRALSAGAATDSVFDLTEKISAQTDVPLIYMTYLNVLYKYGYEKFMAKAAAAGVSGIIVFDLPFEEKNELQGVADDCGIDIISVIASADEERIGMIAGEAKGFIYAAPSPRVNASTHEIIADLESITKAVKKVTNIPVAVGLGISGAENAEKYSRVADGVIIDSAIVKLVAEYGENAPEKVYEYVKSVKSALSE